jgi:site-specific recombinase XerD
MSEGTRLHPTKRAGVSPLDVDHLIGLFLAAQLSPRTRASYSSDLQHFLGWATRAGVDPVDATSHDIDNYRNSLGELVDAEGRPSGKPRYSNATIARRLSALRSFYAFLVERGYADTSPAVGIKTPTVSKDPAGKGLSSEQLTRLLDAAERHSIDAHAVVCLLALAGLRASEVCNADIEDLHGEDGELSLRVQGKGGQVTLVALNARTQRAVTAAVAGRQRGPLVRRPGDRRRRDVARLRPFNRQAIWAIVRELGTASGLAPRRGPAEVHLHPHALRHTYVTLMLDAGAPLASVQDAARHASPATTRRYDRSRSAFKESPAHLLTF